MGSTNEIYVSLWKWLKSVTQGNLLKKSFLKANGKAVWKALKWKTFSQVAGQMGFPNQQESKAKTN